MSIRWQTLSGNLGTIANGNIVSDTLIATTNQSFEVTYPNLVTDIISPNIYYTLLAGSLPENLTLSNDTVNNQATISGIVSKTNVSNYKLFTIRATEYIPEPNTIINDSNITLTSSDRSFGYFWVGQTAPITSNATLTNVNIGLYYEYQLTVDNDAENVTWSLIDSIIHPNLTLYANGLISGYVSPTNATSFTYNIQASNNIGQSISSYEIPVTTPNVSAVYDPFITTDGGVIVSQRRGTAVYKIINAHDYNGDTVSFTLSNTLPSGLTANTINNNYIISGKISNEGLGTINYNFSLTPTKSNANVIYTGDTKNFTITVLGKQENTPIWVTDSNLGILDSSVSSELYVKVITQSGLQFNYKLADNSPPLPDGLELKSDGTIVGKIRSDIPAGTFYEFSFIVEATSTTETVTKEFNILAKSRTDRPFSSLYLRMIPTLLQRKKYTDIINNSDIIPYENIYRPLDPWFGINKFRRILFATGLESKTIKHLLDAMQVHHWWKNLRIGDVKTAIARDENLNEIYEVVYAELIDDAKVGDLIPDANVSVETDFGTIMVDSNSLYRMTEQIVNQINYEDRGIIPTWMQTSQTDGKIPGFKIVFPIVYTKPGKGQETAERLRRNQRNLNSIEFTVDRYEFDGASVNLPKPIVLSPNTEINTNNTINVSTIVGQTSVTLSSTDYKFLNTNQNEIVLYDGMKIKFTNSANLEYRLGTFVVTGVGSNIQLVPYNLQTITTNGQYVLGNNTFFATNINPDFFSYQIHQDDWIVTSNGNIVGKVEQIISNTNIKLNANFSISSVSEPTMFQHTNWLPSGTPVEGDKYLIFPRKKVYNINE